MTPMASHARCAIVERCMYKTMQVAEYNVEVTESAAQANTGSVCVIRTTVGQHYNRYRVSLRSLGF